MLLKSLYQAFVGVVSLLAALSPGLGHLAANDIADQQSQLLLSGSVCRVRNTLDFLDVSPESNPSTFLRKTNTGTNLVQNIVGNYQARPPVIDDYLVDLFSY